MCTTYFILCFVLPFYACVHAARLVDRTPEINPFPVIPPVKSGTEAAAVAAGANGRSLKAKQQSVRDLQQFSISLRLNVPKPSLQQRLPQCLEQQQVANILKSSINEKYAALMAGGEVTAVDLVTFTQGDFDGTKEDECFYSHLVSYRGTPGLKNMLAQGLTAQDSVAALCSALLPQFCDGVKAAGAAAAATTMLSVSVDASALLPVQQFNCVQRYFTQQLDHFAANDDKRTFSQKYWVCDGAWPKRRSAQEKRGAVILYLGGEGPLAPPDAPIIFENAARLNALVVAIEHRYYGESYPFEGSDAAQMPTEQYQWLTIEQVIEDSSAVLQAVRSELRVPKATPNIPVGGGYAGMLAAYHRVQKPTTFNAAVASSAPVYYSLGTIPWEVYSERYHQTATATVGALSGGKDCGATIRAGLDQMLLLGKTTDGRQQLAALTNLCGDSAVAIPTEKAAFSLMMDFLYAWEGEYIQNNNQGPLLGQTGIACNVLQQSVQRNAGDAYLSIKALADVASYFNNDGSASWCYTPKKSPDLSSYLLPRSHPSYCYQICTQGMFETPILTSTGYKGSIAPNFTVSLTDVRAECVAMFGPGLPELKVPAFASNIRRLITTTGGIVFTNGQLDPMSGGSILSISEMLPRTVVIAESGLSGNTVTTAQDSSAGSPPRRNLAFVLYPNAGHSSDLSRVMASIGQAGGWKSQRSDVMDLAMRFARPSKKSL